MLKDCILAQSKIYFMHVIKTDLTDALLLTAR